MFHFASPGVACFSIFFFGELCVDITIEAFQHQLIGINPQVGSTQLIGSSHIEKGEIIDRDWEHAVFPGVRKGRISQFL